jgi:hypothetical protein
VLVPDSDIITIGLLPRRPSIHPELYEVVLVWQVDNRPDIKTFNNNSNKINNIKFKTEVNSNVPAVYKVMERALGGTTFHIKCPPISSTTLPLEVRTTV